jgi:Na+/H+ antiporter NhaD/arsenite permease-like protein
VEESPPNGTASETASELREGNSTGERDRRNGDGGDQQGDTRGEVFFEMHVYQLGRIGKAKVALCAVILVGVLVLIATEVIHRTLVAFLGSFVTFGLLLWCRMLPDMQEVVTWIDESTIILLFGMMIMIGKLAETGMFEVATAKVVAMSRGDLSRLTTIMCLLTASLSAFLDNVTTMMLITPITIDLCAAVQLESPVPLLITLTMFSNIGGAATMIGDPPNLIIGSAIDELSFADFLAAMLPAVAIMFYPILLFVKWLYKGKLEGKLANFEKAQKMCSTHKIKDPILLIQASLCLGMVIVLLLLHSVHHTDHSWLALLGAVALMLVRDPRKIAYKLPTNCLCLFPLVWSFHPRAEHCRAYGLASATVWLGSLASVGGCSDLRAENIAS